MFYVHVLLLAPVALATVLPRDDWNAKVDAWANDKKPPKELVDAFRSVGAQTELTLADYSQPNEYLSVVLSPGDSYTAGIGSNGPSNWYKDSRTVGDDPPGCSRYAKAWPERLRDYQGWEELQGPGWRKNNFGACSGAVIDGIMEKQLQLGQNRDEDEYKKIGEGDLAPQVAVLTAGGNDANFSQIITYCIFRWDTDKTCEEVLAPVEDDITTRRDEWKKHFKSLWSKIIAVGRAAKGADPPESFQIYQGGYIPFWNEDDEVCDNHSWSFNFFSRQYLTRDFRKRLNKLTLELNGIIKEAAEEYKSNGVTYVDSYIKDFDGHRFCDSIGSKKDDERYHDLSHQDWGKQTWFWSFWSKWDDTEGPDDPVAASVFNQDEKINLTQAIYDHLIPDKKQQAQIGKDNPPSKFNKAFSDPHLFSAALRDLVVKDEDGNNVADGYFDNDSWWRLFHPKGTALEVMARSFFEAIKENRKWDFNKKGKTELTCNQLKSDTGTYITRDTLNDLIVNKHCPKLKGATGDIGVGTYLGETPEAVEIHVNGDLSAEGSPSEEDCIKNLQALLDGCDNDGDANPMNWKAGGELVEGSWTYSIRLLHDRPTPYPQKPQAWCQLESCDDKIGCVVRIWGAGWENSGFGIELRQQFEDLQTILVAQGKLGDHVGVNTSNWGQDFRYELKDGREWTVTLLIDNGIFAGSAEEQVPVVMRTAAKPGDDSYLQINDLVDGKCKIV
ncbi:SGNH hydrolase [Amniculicola lignicola CBS 123094]|uniref:SGNH hydrolase n=1 Tax=Amniculicola lignicola CBS 123094 TaxID=1392246 RepID=A0A6A5WI85_9PLEO|nr:SGNH hydrolase [Amniculicola lignicola CBS 123094]